MSTRPEECGMCGHDHSSEETCFIAGCECSDDFDVLVPDDDAAEEVECAGERNA